MSRFSFEQDENGPFFFLTINDGVEDRRLRIDWDTTSLFTHQHKDRHFDHVFVEIEELEESTDDTYRAVGAFIWRQVLPDWDDLKNALITHDFQHIHKPYVADVDEQQYYATGLIPPEQNFVKSDKEVIVIEETEDNDVVSKAIENIDHEINWFLNDHHFYDRIKPRKDDGTT